MIDLQAALDAELAGSSSSQLAPVVARLIDRYQADRPAESPILNGPQDAAAYAAYRMPATYAAALAALRQTATAMSTAPLSLLDVGGGSGAASWAACRVFPEIARVVITDSVPDLLELGARLAAHHPTLRTATWRQHHLDGAIPLPDADLVVLSYVLTELAESTRTQVIARLAENAGTVVVIEPGTPAGYRRILAVRTAFLQASLRILAPCPHEQECPLTDADWCHFGARLVRSRTHRQVKQASLGYEDEKFAFVAASRHPAVADGGRILRHPVTRKGMVELRVCTTDGRTERSVITKRQGELYRAARAASWGTGWPPSTVPKAVPDSHAPSTLD